MELQVKVIFTCATVAIAIGIIFINPTADNAGPVWFWRGGLRDPIRNAICRPDGSFRKYTKLGILAWFALFIVVIWLVA